jgi:hypothetical protein
MLNYYIIKCTRQQVKQQEQEYHKIKIIWRMVSGKSEKSKADQFSMVAGFTLKIAKTTRVRSQ